MELFEEGKFNLLNKDEFEFPEIEVKPLDFEYSYKTETLEDNSVLLNISIKNISNKSKQITISLMDDKIKQNFFIIIGLTRQTYIIREKEEININYTLIPYGRGEFHYPLIKIVEKDFNSREKVYSNFYFSDKITII